MTDQPLIYSCSGCSSAAQLANHLAIRMDRLGAAEMSCIAGLGGDVKPLVSLAKSGRPIVMLDGCGMQCGRRTLARHGIEPVLHWDLSRLGVRKEKHADFDRQDAAHHEPSLSAEIALNKTLTPSNGGYNGSNRERLGRRGKTTALNPKTAILAEVATQDVKRPRPGFPF
jgi:uncharacterized metal-binding protein